MTDSPEPREGRKYASATWDEVHPMAERPSVDPHAAVQACEECGGDHWTREHPSERPPVDPLREAAQAVVESWDRLGSDLHDRLNDLSLIVNRAALASPATPRPSHWHNEEGRCAFCSAPHVSDAATPRPEGLDVERLALPWHRETIGHANVFQIADKVARDLAVPLPEGIPPNTDATWIVNAKDQIVCFVGNGPRQTENGDLIIEAVARLSDTGERP